MMDEMLKLPERMFVAGEEPVGIRVTSYGASSGIKKIMNALEEDERAVIRKSTFGKFVQIVEKPSYSGRFGRFVISRQLNVNKKHEIWILFAGKPIRFSLREFAIVIGLPCGKFEKKSKNNISETPYWPSLFGKLETVTVSDVVKMLKKKTVTDFETRVKYACLALLASVLMPTTHHPKILKEHAEEIKDLGDFFRYPWGRLAFDMLISSIKERNEMTLSQNTIAIKGFVHGLQLVMVEAVPALLEVFQVNSTSSSESEGEVEKDEVREKKISLSPGHAREVHEKEKTVVDFIIGDYGEEEIDENELGWSDDEDDVKVDNLLKLINEDHDFTSKMFTRGVTRADVLRMIKEAKEKNGKAKQKKVATNTENGRQSSVGGEGFCLSEENLHQIVEVVWRKMSYENNRLEEKINEALTVLEEVKTIISTIDCDRTVILDMEVTKSLDSHFSKASSKIMDGVDVYLGKAVGEHVNKFLEENRVQSNNLMHEDILSDVPMATTEQEKGRGDVTCLVADKIDADTIVAGVLGDIRADNFDPVCAPGEQIYSESGENHLDGAVGEKEAGLGQHSLTSDKDVSNGDEIGGEGLCDIACRKSKRQKLIPANLVGDYHCDKRLLQRARQSHIIRHFEGRAEDFFGKFCKLIYRKVGVSEQHCGWRCLCVS